MHIQKIDLTRSRIHADSAYQIYRSAFPKEERIPWQMLRFCAKRRNVELCGYLADGVFCGFTYHAVTDDGIMIMFFAVDGTLRSQGYGAAILAHLKALYAPRALLLHVEPLDDPTAANYAERVRRLRFYERNGFCDTGVDVLDVGGWFRILACGDADVKSAYRKAFYALSFGFWRVRLKNGEQRAPAKPRG